MKKIDFTLITEIAGVALVSAGLALFSIPIAMIALGSFLIWITEKAN